MYKLGKYILTAAIIGLFAGCGCGGGDTNSPSLPAVQSNTVTTFAGTAGVNGSADGTGAAASFKNPYGLAIDGSGNLFVGEYISRTIRKITSSGVVTTYAGVAGQSGNGFTIDEGIGAKIYAAFGLTATSTGDLYFADYTANAIRKVTSTGYVSTFVGSLSERGCTDGTGTSAFIGNPTDIKADSAGNFYVVDITNNAIRKITPAGAVTTFVGTCGVTGSADGTGATASFRNPVGLTIDSTNNLYVTDAGNHTIRKITPAGVVTTIAGTAGVSGSTDGTGTAAKFNDPEYITIDANGNLYVTDSGNHTIRKITSAGVVTTIAGTAGSSGSTDAVGSAARFNSPEGIAIDSSGNLYVADYGNKVIRKIAAPF